MANALTRRLRRGKATNETAPAEQAAAPDSDAEASTDAIETPGQDDDTAAAIPTEPKKAQVASQEGGPRARFGAWLGRPSR